MKIVDERAKIFVHGSRETAVDCGVVIYPFAAPETDTVPFAAEIRVLFPDYARTVPEFRINWETSRPVTLETAKQARDALNVAIQIAETEQIP